MLEKIQTDNLQAFSRHDDLRAIADLIKTRLTLASDNGRID